MDRQKWLSNRWIPSLLLLMAALVWLQVGQVTYSAATNENSADVNLYRQAVDGDSGGDPTTTIINGEETFVIDITYDGLEPALVGILPGTTIVWRNNTTETLTLQSGAQYQIFLPLLSAQSTAAVSDVQRAPSVHSAPSTAAQGGFGGQISPNGEFQWTFEEVGSHNYAINQWPEFQGTIIVGVAPVELLQVAPDTDPNAEWEIILEPVADPHTDRQTQVNFAFDLKNTSGLQLDLREIQFDYLDANNANILQQVVSPDQIADTMLLNSSDSENWWMEGNAALVGQEWEDFLAAWQDIEEQGLRMIDIESYVENGTRLYSGLFTPATYDKAALVGLEWDEFLAGWQELEDQGFRIIDLEIYQSDNTHRYIGIFKPATYAKAALVGQEWDDFLADWQELEEQGFRIIDIEVYQSGSDTLFAGIFKPANYAKAALVGLEWDEFLSGWQDLEQQGFRLFDLELYNQGGKTLYAGIFKPASYAKAALVDMPYADFFSNWQEIEYSGMRMIDMESRLEEGQSLFSGIFAPAPALHWLSDKPLLFISPQASFEQTMPTSVKVTLKFDNTQPWVFEVPIAVYENQNPAQSYPFFAKQEDLPEEQYWFMGNHAAHEGPKPWLGSQNVNRRSDLHRGAIWAGGGDYAFGQQYGYDLAVAGWNGSAWTDCSDNCDQNSDFFVWEVPLYAVEEGTVLYCWRDFEDNPAPGEILERPAGVPGGGNILWIEHTGGEVALYAHFRQNTIPESVCPQNGEQTSPVSVTKGQFLGQAGNSGASSKPHTHFHLQASWSISPLDKGQGIPILFDNILVGKKESQPNISWLEVNKQSLVGNASVSATSSDTLIQAEPAPVELLQVAPDTDPNAEWEIILEPVADPHTDRQTQVNFAFDLKNTSGQQLDLREIQFDYLDANNANILQQVVSPDQIADTMLLNSSDSENWWMEGKAALVGQEWDDFLAGWQDLEDQGLRMIDIESYVENGTRLYSGLFTPATYDKAALVGLEWDEFLAGWQELEDQGFRIIDLEIYQSDNILKYIGIFKPATYAKAALVGQEWDDFLADWQELEEQGFRIIDIEVYQSGGNTLFAGIFKPANYAKAALVGLEWNEFLSGWQDLEEQGFRLFELELYNEGGKTLYAGIFKPASYAKAALVDMPYADFFSNWQEIEYSGMRMIDMEIRLEEGQSLFSGIFAPGPALHWLSDKSLLFISPQASFEGTMPTSVKVSLKFDNALPWAFDVPIAVYENQNPTQSYPFFAKQEDLREDRYWFMGNHAAHEGPKPWLGSQNVNRRSDLHRGAIWAGGGDYAFGQQYGYDLAVAGWDGSAWTDCTDNCDENSDFFVWEVPLYAVEEGTVLYCWRDFEDNPAPGEILERPAGVPGGGNILWIEHTGGEVALYAHFRQNTIPESVCPQNGEQASPVSVTKGQFLGQAGNSGASSKPHTHFHLQASWTINPLDKGQGIPILFDNISVGKKESQLNISWLDVNKQGLVGNASVSATSSDTLIQIDN